MTLEEVKDASDRQLNEQIATKLGWLNIHASGRLDGQIVGTNPNAAIIGKYDPIPDFANDVKSIVNAISDHMATHPMDRFIDELNRFISILEKLCPDMEDLWNAPARPRAEAFVVYMETR